MLTEEDLEKRGKRFFEKLNPDDKSALRSYITGQIRNVLANEFGIGGRASVENDIKAAARDRVEKVLGDADFLALNIEKILKTRSYNMISIIEKVAAAEAQKALADRFNDAAKEITFYVSVEQKEKMQPENFGKF